MAKRMKEPEKRLKLNKLINIILVIVFLVSTWYIIKYFYGINNSNRANDVINDVHIEKTKVTEEKTERMLQLEELQKENEDIVAYLEIEGTDISYPVLQGDDNEYYMTHTYKKEYSKDGSIFLDKDYDWSIPSSNLLLYGHNNKNGNMFAKLLDYEKEAFYKEHPTIRFTTNQEDAEYEIIAAFRSRVYYKSEKNVFRYYYFINAENEKEFNDYVVNSKKASLYDTGKTAKYGEQLLTLSTCAYHTEDGRFAVVARKINK